MKKLRHTLAITGLFASQFAAGAQYSATPDDYVAALSRLKAGDTLVLQPGLYRRGLPIHGLHGETARPIVISGPPSGGGMAVLIGRAGANTISIRDASHVQIRNLRVDGGGLEVDGVRAEAESRLTHHITIENLVLVGFGHDQQTVAISTQSPAWNWTIRGNVIIGAGTGMYLGGSDGGVPFVGGLIEHNLVVDTLGYNVQVKHQNERRLSDGFPTGPHRTIIRHNVFSKANHAAGGPSARPNLLVGHFPRQGPGANDEYAIYGNFFFENPTEALFQGEGNIAFYANVLVNSGGSAVVIQPHNDRPKRVRIFNNTILARDVGVRFQGMDDAFTQFVSRNAVFATQPLSGRDDGGNLTAPRDAASNFLVAAGPPSGAGLDLSWRHGMGTGTGPKIDIAGLPDVGVDFDGRPRRPEDIGAYTSRSEGPRWGLQLLRKPHVPPGRPESKARATAR